MKGQWVLQVKNLESGEEFTDEAEYFINAGGVLNNFKMPDIDGIKDFKGKLMHSAAYEEGYDLKDKKVAVVGAGSSGVQIVANVIGEVKQLYHWVCQPIALSSLRVVTDLLYSGTLANMDHGRLRSDVGWQGRRKLQI